MASRPLIIINEAAAKARRVWPMVQQHLKTSSVDFDFYETTQPGDATARTRAALKSGITAIAVVGGDGTLGEAAEGFFEFPENMTLTPNAINSSASLAVLPAGTGDDFARGLLGKRAPLEKWIQIFVTHCRAGIVNTTRAVDVLYGVCNGYTEPFICLNASTMGIGGETAARVAAQRDFLRKFSGEVRFVVGAVGSLLAWRERRVRVTVDGVTVDCGMNLAGVANSVYAGGGMMLAPDARIDDGMLDVVTACGLTRANVVRELGRIHKGGHVANPKVRIIQGKQVRIETFSDPDAMLIEVDGNVRGRTPVEFRVIPKALRFVA